MPLDYNARAALLARKNSPHYHTSACLSNSVDAFCDDLPDPGCICGGDPDAREVEADERDAALDAAEFNDPREQERLDHEADLRYEYSKPEYHDFEDCGGLHDFNDED